MHKNWATTTLCAAIGLALSPVAMGAGVAASFPSGVANVPFDLLPPGARSLGLAGAFTAVADDATAAEANPAGLANLTRPEISLHGRRTSFDLTGFNGDANYADIYDGQAVDPFPLYNKSSDDTSAVAFASYVHPFTNGALSFYYQNTGKIKAKSLHTGEDVFFNDFFTFENNVDLNAESLGFSAAYRLNDLLAVGGSLRWSRLELNSLSRNSTEFLFDLERQGGGVINTAGITDNVFFQRAVDDDDTDFTFNLGILINPQGKFSAGLVYKDGGSYDLKTSAAFGIDVSCTIAPGQNCGGTGQNVDFSASDSQVRTRTIQLPDVLNLGFAYRPTDTWLVSFDIHHTRYSQLPALPAESLIFGAPAPNATVTLTEEPDGSVTRTTSIKRLSDSTTYHLGVEHVFLFGEPMMGMKTLSLRGGVFNEKDLGTYSDDNVRGLPGVDTRDTHYTVGLGSTFGDHVQVDLGAEFSEDTDNLVLSAIYRF